MKHFGYLESERVSKIFYKTPESVKIESPKEMLSISLGGTLYIPGIRNDIPQLFIENKFPALSSVVFCLEDSIDDRNTDQATNILLNSLYIINNALSECRIHKDNMPLLFIRIKNNATLEKLIDNNENLKNICGFVLPKVNSLNVQKYFETIESASKVANRMFYIMPILESKELIYKDTRLEEFNKLNFIFNKYKDYILNLRIGGTDLCSLFSIRRGIENSIYDVSLIRDLISDTVNYFKRPENNFTISGPVWEHYSNSFFEDKYTKVDFEKIKLEMILYGEYYSDEIFNGLIKEIKLDMLNGLIGKTVIHPGHVVAVNSLLAVKKEDYDDAILILNNKTGGAIASNYNNKMNEPKPHTRWAENILLKSKVYGVLNYGYDYKNIIKK